MHLLGEYNLSCQDLTQVFFRIDLKQVSWLFENFLKVYAGAILGLLYDLRKEEFFICI
jgi:hypothetical protein